MPRKKSKANSKSKKPSFNSPASPFVTFKIGGEKLKQFGKTDQELDQILTAKQARLQKEKYDAQIAAQEPEPFTQCEAQTDATPASSAPEGKVAEPPTPPEEDLDEEVMREGLRKNAWATNRANPTNRQSPSIPSNVSDSPASGDRSANKVDLPSGTSAKGIAPKSSGLGKRQRRSRTKTSSSRKQKEVAFDGEVELVDTPPKNGEGEAVSSSDEDELEERDDLENETDKENYESQRPAKRLKMADGGRPTLKLKMSTLGGPSAQPAVQPLATPVPQSANQRLKLSFGRAPSISLKKEDSPSTGSSNKKRKRDSALPDADEESPVPKPSLGPRKITFKATTAPTLPTPTSAVTPAINLIAPKGKPPPRKHGVGYDSENEDTEKDPVIHEGFILRMPPGPDCEYVKKAIEDGNIGKSVVQGGADVSIRMLDTHGRRGVMKVNKHMYATTLVDLPCIIEAMKSWDRKAFVKSLDICQMLLVLGPCHSDEEARNYPLPEGVEHGSYKYAHGITPPMHHVRTRRFARTGRRKVDDIEAVERKVNAMLADDARAIDSTFEILDHDPRDDEDSEEESEGEEDSDAEGEEDEGEDYFGTQPIGQETEEPTYETPQAIDEDVDDEEMDDFLKELQQTDTDADGLNVPESSFAVTSTSASPSASANVTGVGTPASAGATSDEDADGDDDDDDEEKDESDKEEDDNIVQTKERIAELERKIQQQKETLRRQENAILRRRVAIKIGELEKEVGMMRRQIGQADPEDGDGGDGGE